MFLLSIWVVAYGVAKQGILIHNENRLDWIIRGVLYEPYLIIFGQFPKNIDSEWILRILYFKKYIYIFNFSCNNLFQYFVTHIYSPPKASTLLITNEDVIFLPADTEFDMNSCSVNATDPLKPKCPVLNENQSPVFPEWLTIIMLCVYLLFANILLLNLLIAIFK